MNEIQLRSVKTLKDYLIIGTGIKSVLTNILSLQRDSLLYESIQDGLLNNVKNIKDVDELRLTLEGKIPISINNIISWLRAYESALQSIANVDALYNDDPNYFHNHLDKLLSTTSDLRDGYDKAYMFLSKNLSNQQFRQIISLSKDVVNQYIDQVCELVELDDTFINQMERLNIDYKKKYSLIKIK